ncbi:MAG: chemotaxis protein CheB [Ferruginibacter sp.]
MQSTANKPLSKSANLFPVVGIGASAGGLEAFKTLIGSIPANSGMAYVLVQHLDPRHESLLPELLQKVSKIPVLEITNEIRVKPDHIYIIPSNKMLLANDGVLQLSPRQSIKNRLHLPIDLFFNSLAEVHQAHAIGVVLSGTASDGTLGLKAIKDNGGMTFAQDEASAAYDGMPHSAAQAGVVDFIMDPGKIPAKIFELTKNIYLTGPDDQYLLHQDEAIYKQILLLLRIRKGTDFTYYKQTTIRRRILRRMAFNKKEGPAAYLKYLNEHSPEQDVLYLDLLIPVTSFFRDTNAFQNLCDNILPLIVKNKGITEPIRIWVAGCSTGQEAYSIAICFKEYMAENFPGIPDERVQIFASDMSEPAISKARTGIYAKNEIEGLTPLHLKQYFTKDIHGYHVNKALRDICVFANHNFLSDPPFGKMDLVTCRNVLIYLEPYLQKKALTAFHYALKVNGFLLLGKSETNNNLPELFTLTGKKDKIFKRKDVPAKFMYTVAQRGEHSQEEINKHFNGEHISTDFQKIADDIILSKYIPAGVVVNRKFNIVHFRGSTGAFLEPPSGEASLNILKMAKEGLAVELRTILQKIKKDNRPVTKAGIQMMIRGGIRSISIEATPLSAAPEPHYLILFHEQPAVNKKQPLVKPSSKTEKGDNELRIQQLELELAQCREDMHSITEEQESANAALESANEELLSGSEEWQSLNDELQASKEELQSTNEELVVVNQEIINLVEQVTHARDYAESIVTTIREPLLVLDEKLRVNSANKAFYKMFQVNERETEGVLIYDLGDKQWNVPSLKILLEDTLTKEIPCKDIEVTNNFPTIGKRVMLLNACKFAMSNEGEQLILLVIEDVTEKNDLHLIELKFQKELEEKVNQRTIELSEANESLQLKNQEIALSKYNKRFLTEFSEKFSAYTIQKDFFQSLVHFIADTTSLDYAFVGKLEQNEMAELSIQTIAFSAFGKLTENIRYQLPNGPCEQVISGTLYRYPNQCGQTFQNNKTIQQFNVDGYLGFPLHDEQGNVVGLIAVMHQTEIEDTETVGSVLKIVARRAEIELQRIKHEEQLRENNNALKEKNNELLKMNKELEAFTYVSSHDLQEPLRKIKTFISLLVKNENEQLSVDGKDYLKRISKASLRMKTLIEDLLSYSRINTKEHTFESTDLNLITDEVLIDFSEKIDEKNAIIKVEALCKLSINPSQFRQLMQNLIGNALKFSRPGVQPQITIKSKIDKGSNFKNEKLIPGKEYCHLTITDNGIGFDPKYKDRIFEVFQRLYGKDEYEGTGIGLAIVKKIVDNHGGYITASGVPNEGATFDIYIPA